MNADSFCEMVTARLLAVMEEGKSPWERPFASQGIPWPTNPVTGKRYTGMNAFWLDFVGGGLFATYNQWADAGAQVRKGEKSVPVLRPLEIKKAFKDAAEGQDEPEKLLFFKPYAVFSIDQVDGADHLRPPPVVLKPVERNAIIEESVAKTGARIVPDLSQCFYRPASDTVHMVDAGAFTSIEHFYATEFHELGHWSGGKGRLERDLSGRFGTHAYAAEELIAEMTASYACHHFGIDSLDRHNAAYLSSWVSLFRDDKKAILTAAGHATRALKHLFPEVA